jgi:hypothetical protein
MSCIKPIFNHLVMQCVYSFFFSVVINSNAHVYRPNVAWSSETCWLFTFPGDGEPEETVPASEIRLMACAIVDLAPAICSCRSNWEPKT